MLMFLDDDENWELSATAVCVYFCLSVVWKHMIYLAADHRGFELKEMLKKVLLEQGFEVEDMGARTHDKEDDYVDFARAALEKIKENPGLHKWVFLCGSGHGMDMVANKYPGVRAALCWNTQVAIQSREHEDANVLVLAADWLDAAAAEDIVSAWLKTQFSGEERHSRRLEKIKQIEDRNFK